MGAEQFRIYRRPRATETRMILGFSGWMDGGEVSTGTVNYLLRKLKTVRVGRNLEVQVNKMMSDNEELSDMVRKLESQYDSDFLQTEMGDLKEWLEDQGFELP